MKVKSLLLVLGLSLVVGKSFAISFKVDGINYVANADTAIVKGYSEIPENGELKLTSTVTYGGKDYRVTTVQGSAFLSCTDIKKLIVPASVKYIQSGAFENCVNMSNLILEQGDDVLDAASDAFKNCEIEEATIGRNLEKSIFENVSSLASVRLESNINVIVPKLFYSCVKLANVEMENVEYIGYKAFYGCSSLKMISFGKIKEIGSSAFSYSGIERLNLPSSLVKIEEAAFKNCSSLEEIVDNSRTEEISASTYSGCVSLVSFNFRSSIMEIGDNAFSGTGLEKIILPDNVRKLGDSCFEGCKQLKEIQIKSELKQIPSCCFKWCSSVTKLSLPQSIEFLGQEAFAFMNSLKEVDMSVTKIQSISSRCFYRCEALETICLSEKTDTIGSYAFSDCSMLTNVENTSQIKIVYSNAFERTKVFEDSSDGPVMIGTVVYAYKGTIDAKEYIVPSDITCIADNVYSNQNFQTIKLSEKLKYVGENAFSNCRNLVTLDIPSSVEVFGGNFGCYKLASITVEEGKTPLLLGSFRDSDIKRLYLGRNVTNIDWMPNLNSLKIGRNVDSIVGSFVSSTKLINLEIEDSPNSLKIGRLPIDAIKSLYLGRSIEYPIHLPNGYDINHFENLEQLTFGAYVDSIPDNFVSGNEVLKEIELPSSVRVIGYCAFSGLKNVEKFRLHDGLEKIREGGLSFNNVSHLDSLTIPSTVKTIEGFGAMGIKCDKFIVSEGVQNIGHQAFYNLDTDTLVLPSTCKIDYQCFEFSKIKYLDASKYHGNFKSAFAYNENLEKVIMPKEGMTVLSENEFWGCKNLKQIVLPNTLDSISHSVFGGTQITEVHIPQSVSAISNRMFCTTNGTLLKNKPTVYIDGYRRANSIKLNKTFEAEMYTNEFHLAKLDVAKSFIYDFMDSFDNSCMVYMDSLVIRDIEDFCLLTKEESRFIPATAICLSPHLTSCDLWKPTNGKVFVLPGSQLPKEDVSYMYTVNKLEYVPDADGNVLFDGVNNMPYDITPVFYQDDKEVELREAGVYDLSMKIAGTSFDGIYPTGLKVTVKSATGINRVVLDSDSQHCPIYNMNGQRVDGSYKGVVIQNGKKRIAK